MVKGECNCGAVAFEVDSSIEDIFMCHCSICRRFTGNNGVAVVIVPTQQFRWLRGEEYVTTWQNPKCDWQSSFCRTCGSSLPGINDDAHMYIPAGLIVEGGESLKVAHHLWVDSKAQWYEIGDEGKQHGTSFNNTDEK